MLLLSLFRNLLEFSLHFWYNKNSWFLITVFIIGIECIFNYMILQDDEVDPLDAFMTGIQEEVRRINRAGKPVTSIITKKGTSHYILYFSTFVYSGSISGKCAKIL